jgi:hypothetical protein
MSNILTAEDARQSLGGHAAAKGAEIFEKYGPHIGWNQLQRILQDRACVRYPCEVDFDPTHLQPGECAYPDPKGASPEDGFVIHVQPLFMTRLERVAHLVLYQLVVVNYGRFACSGDAERFGAAALGLAREEYYEGLCDMADWLDGRPKSCEG